VEDMTTPTALFYGEVDGLADPVDVLTLKTKITNLVHVEEIKEWNHLDFLYGVDAAKILYPKIVQMLKDTLE
jgi:lysosomal acid lipase/cholesteryl ester hydrolase